MTHESHASYDASSMPHGLDIEVERLRAQALISWPKEARNLRWMGLEPHMTVLELGSGPGFVTEQLLGLVPDGAVVALEIDPVLIARAETYLQSRGVAGWSIVRGNVMSTGLPANTFDLAYGRYLFQHLPDPLGAAREVLRVLKPGGKLVIFDVDDALNIIDPLGSAEIQALEARVSAAFRAEQASKGGNRLIGRRLLPILRDAGFQDLDLEAVIGHSVLTDLSALVPKPSRESLAPLLDRGLMSEAELQLTLDEFAHFEAADPVIMLTALMARGAKPPTPLTDTSACGGMKTPSY